MKRVAFSLPLFLAVIGFAGSAAAADCVITYNRTACAGQEATSYAKCEGKQACDKDNPATSQEACVEAAKKACPNDRTDITKSKKIYAKFKGAALAGGYNDAGAADPKGTNFCAGDRPDFNKCK
ncbi:MAG: hypothetical protein G8237_13645 [Magnetococcales bacterium]|nr:hypothetical protein [Magnetococcales bacterium]